MKKSTLVLVITLFCLLLSAETVKLGSEPNSIDVLTSSENETILQYRIGSFEQEEVKIDEDIWYHIRLPKEGVSQDKGFPELPVFNRSIIIPDQRAMNLQVYDIRYQDIKLQVAPSRGVITRDIDPATVPYTFDPVYHSRGFYPEQLARLSDPYILRDFRGLTVQTSPFAFDPSTGILRVYTSFKIRVFNSGFSSQNALYGTRDRISRSYLPIYENHFLNFNSYRYTPVDDSYGKLLVICHSNYLSTILPYVNWKKQKGIETELIEWSTICSTAAQLQTYIQNRYNADNTITYVQLVGDAPQIPSLSSGGGGSDPSFSLVAGSDNYPDIFIGRFSAETAAQVTAQINKAITYERDLNSTDTWLNRALGIASAEGGGTQGDNGESDIAHMNLIRTDLLNYGYTSVDQVYDPGASAATVTTNVNAGRGFINYVGHGSNTSWSTTGFSSTNASALTNGSKTPFIMDVACVNGNFVSITCFAEAWQRNANGGSVAIYASSINQSWNSPMRAQDEVTDLLIAEAKNTVGGLYYNGACKMMDIYGNTSGSDGVNMFKTWHIFGDASLMARTKTPIAMSVNHPASIVSGITSVNVTTGVPNALVAITYNNTIYGRGFTNSSGSATITLSNPPTGVLNYTITATAFNRVSYLGTIAQTVASGPWMEVSSATWNDGNNNLPEFSESGYLDVMFTNSGTATAMDVTATLSSSSSGITITANSYTIADLAAGANINADNCFAYSIADNIPNGTVANFTITMVGSSTWTYNFSTQINAPALAFGNLTISDPSGNNNGLLDPGETVLVTIPLNNFGAAASLSGTGTLSCVTPGVTITNGTCSFNSITAGGSSILSFSLSVSSAVSEGTLASLVFMATAGAHSASASQSVEIGAPMVITIGNGTASQSYPIDRYYNYSSHEAIYLASEIGTSGSIKSIGFYKASGSDVTAIAAVTIYMKNTTASSLASGTYSTSGYTQVYSGSFPNNSSSGWMEVELQNQFPHDGTNLSVLIIKGYQAWISSYPYWTYTTSTSTRARQNRSDDAQPGSLTATTKLPNLKLSLLPIATGPSIMVNPSSISAGAYSGEETSATVTVSNTGTSVLDWTTPENFASWGSVEPASGSIPAGGNSSLNITLNTAGQAVGTYSSSLVISSNASNSPELTIPVTFSVQTSPYPNQPSFVAEWEPAQGALIRYPFGQPNALITEMSNNALLYVIVTSSSQSTCNSALVSMGANLANVRYINASSDSYWTRDYGPWTVFDADHEMRIVDFNYNRPRPNDNLIPSVIANQMGLPYHVMPLNLTGGNMMTDGHGKAMSSSLTLSENSSYTQSQINQMFQDYLGVTDYQLYSDPLANSSIDHIDCWAKLLDVDKVIIAQVPPGHTNYSAIEAQVSLWQSRTSSYGTPYRIFRVFASNNEPYTNSYIMNGKIYVPQMGTANDAAALQTYRNAMPGSTVMGFSHGSSYLSDDAIHCRVNTIFDAQMIRLTHTPLNSAMANHPVNIEVSIAHTNQLSAQQSFVAWAYNENGPWQNSPLIQQGNGLYSASIQAPALGQTLYYWINVTDNTGRTSSKPLCKNLDPFSVVVNIPAPNTAPEINLPASFAVDMNQSLVLDFSDYVSDAENDPLSISVSNAGDLSVQISDLMVSISAPIGWHGSQNLSFTVSDGQESANASTTIVITPVNLPVWTPVTYPTAPAVVHGNVTVFGVPALAGDIVAAFSGDECRGLGTISVIDGVALVTIEIHLSGLRETVILKLYSFAGDAVYPITEFYQLTSGEVLGEDEPVPMTAVLVTELAAPQIIHTGISAAGLTLCWNPVTGAQYYMIYAADSPGAQFNLVGSTSNLWWSESQSHSSRFYKVVACDSHSRQAR